MDLKNSLEYASFRALLALLKGLPSGQAADFLSAMGRFTGSVLRIRRRVVEAQLETVYPELSTTDRKVLADRIYEHLGRTAGEVFGPGVDDLLAGAVVEPGWDGVDEALSLGRGAIVVTGHIGNFELGGALIAQRYSLLDVIKTQRNPAFDGYLQGLRHARGIRTVPMGQPGRAVLKQLKAGGLVSLLIDQDAGSAGVRTKFLGHWASTWTGAARFSIRTGCPVIPLAMFRRDSGRHVLRIAQPLHCGDLTDRHEDVVAYTTRISAAVEEFIRQEPEQWFWVHRRWKSASKGAE